MLSGQGYVMTRQTSRCLYLAVKEIPFFHLEDVYVTGFAAEMCDVPRIHVDGFDNFGEALHHLEKRYYTIHYTTPQKMKELFLKDIQTKKLIKP